MLFIIGLKKCILEATLGAMNLKSYKPNIPKDYHVFHGLIFLKCQQSFHYYFLKFIHCNIAELSFSGLRQLLSV